MQNGWRFVLGRGFERYGLVSTIIIVVRRRTVEIMDNAKRPKTSSGQPAAYENLRTTVSKGAFT